MSLGYAERLSHREDLGGRLGDPELLEPAHVVLDKSIKLAELVRDASKVIVFTGAGISTAAGIPDFRGPQGVWTLQRKGLPLPKLQTSFVYAKPSLTHQALLGLMQSGKLDYICSQNVDSLHLRSGVPRDQLAELHGNCFAERCKKCKTEYVRDFEMDTVGFKQTGRCCSKQGCSGMLVDHILDWEDALPPAELKATQQHASSADLAMCLGTSLQIIPAANLPLRTVKAGGKLAIINLQATPKDKKAEVVIHAKVDEVMSVIMQRVGIPIPVYTRTDRVVLSHTTTLGSSSDSKQQLRSAAEPAAEEAQAQPQANQQVQETALQEKNDMNGAAAADDGGVEHGGVPQGAPAAAAAAAARADDGTGNNNSSSNSSGGAWGFTLCVSSPHGPSCPLPMVASAAVSFLGAAADAGLKPLELAGQLPWKFTRSCPAELQQVTVQVILQLVEAADEDKRCHTLQYTISRPQQQQESSSSSRAKSTRRASSQQQPDSSQVFSFVTQQLDYIERQQQLVQQLQTAAEESRLAAPADAEAEVAPKPQKRSGSNKGSSKRSGGCSQSQQRDGSVSGGRQSRGSRKTGEAGEGKTDAGGADGVEEAAAITNCETPAAGKRVDKSSSQGEEEEDNDEQEQDVAADDSNYNASEESDADAEPTGINGQNTSGRPRKRTKRLNL